MGLAADSGAAVKAIKSAETNLYEGLNTSRLHFQYSAEKKAFPRTGEL